MSFLSNRIGSQIWHDALIEIRDKVMDPVANICDSQGRSIWPEVNKLVKLPVTIQVNEGEVESAIITHEQELPVNS